MKKGIVELFFRPFLRWMDRNMEAIVTEGLKQVIVDWFYLLQSNLFAKVVKRRNKTLALHKSHPLIQRLACSITH